MRILDFFRRIDHENDLAVDVGLLVLRCGAGLVMLLGHGWAKLTTFSEKAAGFADPIGLGPTFSLGLAVFAEFFCSLLLILGLCARFSAVPLFITMAVAAFAVHADDPFRVKEKAIVFGLIYLALFFTGPGRISLSRFLLRGRWH